MKEWKKKAIEWAESQAGKHFCACGCGKAIAVSWYHFHKGVPEVIRGHHIRDTAAQRWINENQGKHFCQCGCGLPIHIKIHHHKRGIPKYINCHASKIIKPGLGKFGPLNPHYKGGRYVNQKGYVQVLIPGPGRSKYVAEHRLIMERVAGRKLGTDETVHHDNRSKSDNRTENLEIKDRAEHSRLHALAGETGFRRLQKLGIDWHQKKI